MNGNEEDRKISYDVHFIFTKCIEPSKIIKRRKIKELKL